MTHEDYEKARNHWIIKDRDGRHPDRKMIEKAVWAYININNTCALATGSGDYVRCTPIEYTFHDGAFWMFSEGGMKFKGLEYNKNVSLAIYDRYDGFESLKGMQVMGKAEIIEPFSDEYVKNAELKKIPIDALKKLPDVMNLIKVIPVEINFLNSEFKKQGYDSRQTISLE